MKDAPLDSEHRQPSPVPEASLREEFARQVDQRYRRRLKAFVRANLNLRVRRNRDATSDVVQNVLKSFFESNESLIDQDDIWPLLCDFAKKKVKNSAKQHTRRKRDVRRERDVDGNDKDAPTAGDVFVERSSDPAPYEALVIADELERLTSDELTIVTMRRDGWSCPAIAEKLGVNDESVIRRRLDRLLDRWRSELAEE